MTGIAEYFSELEKEFEANARANGGPLDHDCLIADRAVRLRFAGNRLIPLLTPALAHLPRTSGTATGLEILVWDQGSSVAAMPPPPWSWENYQSRGEIGGLDPERYRAWFHVASGVLSLVDLARDRALFWVRDAEALPMYVIAAPFRMILQGWLRQFRLYFAHAAAVGMADGAVLLSGEGGSGKSTTSLACLVAGMAFISDDYCLVSAESEPSVHAVYCSGKMDADMLQSFPGLVGSRQVRNDPPGEKALLLMGQTHSPQLPPSLPLSALVAPVVCDQAEPTIEPIKALEAIRALAPSTMEQIAGPDVSAWKTITSLARQLPCYRLRLGRDVAGSPAVIRELLNSLTRCQS